jgi:hypothetical protein
MTPPVSSPVAPREPRADQHDHPATGLVCV